MKVSDILVRLTAHNYQVGEIFIDEKDVEFIVLFSDVITIDNGLECHEWDLNGSSLPLLIVDNPRQA